MDWARMLVCVTGTVGQELLARNEYLTAENRILWPKTILMPERGEISSCSSSY
jgi:hypothetical protein